MLNRPRSPWFCRARNQVLHRAHSRASNQRCSRVLGRLASRLCSPPCNHRGNPRLCQLSSLHANQVLSPVWRRLDSPACNLPRNPLVAHPVSPVISRARGQPRSLVQRRRHSQVCNLAPSRPLSQVRNLLVSLLHNPPALHRVNRADSPAHNHPSNRRINPARSLAGSQVHSPVLCHPLSQVYSLARLRQLNPRPNLRLNLRDNLHRSRAELLQCNPCCVQHRFPLRIRLDNPARSHRLSPRAFPPGNLLDSPQHNRVTSHLVSLLPGPVFNLVQPPPRSLLLNRMFGQLLFRAHSRPCNQAASPLVGRRGNQVECLPVSPAFNPAANRRLDRVHNPAVSLPNSHQCRLRHNHQRSLVGGPPVSRAPYRQTNPPADRRCNPLGCRLRSLADNLLRNQHEVRPRSLLSSHHQHQVVSPRTNLVDNQQLSHLRSLLVALLVSQVGNHQLNHRVDRRLSHQNSPLRSQAGSPAASLAASHQLNPVCSPRLSLPVSLF